MCGFPVDGCCVHIRFPCDENIEERQSLVLFELDSEPQIRMPFVDAFEEFVNLVHVDLKDAEHVVDISQPYLGSIGRESVQFLLHLGHEQISENRCQWAISQFDEFCFPSEIMFSHWMIQLVEGVMNPKPRIEPRIQCNLSFCVLQFAWGMSLVLLWSGWFLHVSYG